MMKISAFGDEIAVDFEEQLQVLQRLQMPLIDVRAAWGINCSLFTDEHIKCIKQLCHQYQIQVACMGSPIGKSPIQDTIIIESDRLKRIGETARQLGTKNIRLFSFYPQTSVNHATIQIAAERLQALVSIAAELDLQLLLENEKGLVGDTPERCLKLLQAVDSPRLKFIWDPANFVQCGAAEQVEQWWDSLYPYTAYIHIKDARLADAAVTPAGEGDGQVKKLLEGLHASGYEGILSLEPHLVEARHSSGFSGADGMKGAVKALRKLMAEVGIQEAQ